MKTGKIIPEMPELISRTPEIVPNACANQREAIASSPGKSGPRKKPTHALALKTITSCPGKRAASRTLSPPPKMHR